VKRFLHAAFGAIAFFAAAVSSCQAQTINCSGPTGGNCVPVVQVPTAPRQAGYPANSTPITAVFSGADTTTAAATLAAPSAGKFDYICGYTVSGLGSTAGGGVSVTVATLAGGNTLTYSYVFAAAVGAQNTPISFTYNPCIPASAAVAAITVTVPGQAGNTATQINAWGYQQ
jgi:hypothetical protein